MRKTSLVAAGVLALALALIPAAASARIGGGSSFGSRGVRTFSMPQATPISPGGAMGVQRSMTPTYGASSAPGYGYGSRGFFGRGFMGGLLGAGLFGLLFGGSLFGGIAGPFSLIGLVIQIGLLVMAYKWVMRWMSGRQFGFAGGAPASAPNGAGLGGFGSAFSAAPAGGGGQPMALQGEDFNAFEYLLQESQTAFGAEDMDRLRRVSTPEMASYFAEQLATNARRGLVNKIADVRLLKGDLSEAWSEPQGDYATVAMSFSLLDWTVERDSGRLEDGDPQRPQQVAEVWTFRRDHGAGAQGWRISAIQQAR